MATTRLRLSVTFAERVGLALVIGLMPTLWLPFLIALALGIHVGGLAALGLTLLLLVIELIWNRPGRDKLIVEFLQGWRAMRSEASARWQFGSTLAFAGLTGWLCHNHYFMPGSDGLYSAGVTWGDSTMHSSFATAFLERGNLHPPDYPFFADWPLGYPFVPDFATANLIGLGLTLQLAFGLTTWLALMALFLLLYSLAQRWSGPEVSAAPFLAVLLFFCSGGMGFLLLFNQGGQSSVLAENYTFQPDRDLFCGNTLGNLLLASRCAAFGMAVGLAVCWLLTSELTRAGRVFSPRPPYSGEDGSGMRGDSPLQEPSAQPRPLSPEYEGRSAFAVAGFLAGTLPLVHSHSFLIIGMVALIYTLQDWRHWPRWLRFFGPFALVALPQLFWIWQHVHQSTSFLFCMPGFRYPLVSPEGLRFWLWNAGLFLVLVPVAWWRAPPQLRQFTAPLLLLFIVGNLVSFTPSYYDNVKVFGYFQIGGAILLGWFLARWLQTARLRVVPGSLLVVLSFSGALAIVYEVRDCRLVVTNEDVAVSEYVKEHTQPEARFLTSSALNHPIPALADGG